LTFLYPVRVGRIASSQALPGDAIYRLLQANHSPENTMKRTRSLVLAACLAALPALALSQTGPGSGPGSGPGASGPGASAPRMGPGAGMGMGPGGGMGPGMRQGGGPRWGNNITPGWTMMTPEERNQHRERMQSMKTFDECQAYRDQHHQQMAERAKQRGANPPARPRRDLCAGLPK
jgi:hypothetical protein